MGQWKKVLWKEQDFADNHVDQSFLDGLEKNSNVSIFTYPSLVYASGAIIQQFSSIFIFCNLFIRIYFHGYEVVFQGLMARLICELSLLSYPLHISFGDRLVTVVTQDHHPPTRKLLFHSGFLLDYIVTITGNIPNTENPYT